MNVIRCERPFTYWLIDDFIADGLRSCYEALIVGSPNIPWVGYANPDERKLATNDFTAVPSSCRDLAESLHSQDWLPQLGRLTGLPRLHCDPTWHGGGFHVTESGGYLGPHLDYALNPKTGMERRVNFILYLTPDWAEAWGGRLHLWNDDATEIQASVHPKFNRAVLWLPGDTTFHSVEPVAPEATRPRISLACYYVAEPRPGVNRKRALFVPQRQAS